MIPSLPRTIFAVIAVVVGIAGTADAVESTCFGTVSRGRLENGVKLPGEGRNFNAYSAMGVALGRTHVHSTVAKIVVAAYGALEQSAPDKVFVYGETGWPGGGRIRPHRTHRNGLSVDFMVPVVDAAGRSVPLPASAGNKFGYAIEFDRDARFDGYRIDFAAIGEHLYQLDLAARAHGAGVARVIFDPPYLPQLFATRRGAYLKSRLAFMKGKAWVRHDEHYHVDFALPCQPMRD